MRQTLKILPILNLVLCLGAASSTGEPQLGAVARNQSRQGHFVTMSRNEARQDEDEAVAVAQEPGLKQFGIYAKTAPRAEEVDPNSTKLPLELKRGDRIALIGNTLFERLRLHGDFEAFVQQQFPGHELVFRNLAWAADTVELQPRPANFADTEQHLAHEGVDVVLAAFGFNESFAGEEGTDDFRRALSNYVQRLKRLAFNGESGPRIVLVSPIANENVAKVPAATLNNRRIESYVEVMRQVAEENEVGFADVFTELQIAMRDTESDLTTNGVHLNSRGYELFSQVLFVQVFGRTAPETTPELRAAIVDKNRQYFRRFRPLNTFYYTGGRNGAYGYLDFLPAMRNFDMMVANRDQRIHAIVKKEPVGPWIDDSNVPVLPKTKQSRGANTWLSADDELQAFEVDPRFEVNLFASEEEFPEIAAPIQMRWDSRGRLWVSCSTTYPHVYPGNEPNDKLVILEDTDGDGRADKSSVFADDLHIPLSFEFGDGGVYVSEMPQLTFLKDTDGDGQADLREIVLSGFGTEDSHHALHDFTWTPDGDLLFRESIFHHSQVETPYGPVRQQNSGWFRFRPSIQELVSFGTYHSTNPWGVTFDDWGQHVASHPIYAAAFHSLDPPFPKQHPKPAGLRAYSGTCGQQFVESPSFPESLRGSFIKVRYKPTNRVEIHNWKQGEFGYDEEYVGDLIFSKDLSFIPVDLQWGPRGALYVCDWYNPVKGHAQYSLRDERRDRSSGRIWRVTARDHQLTDPPRIHDATINELFELLRRPESNIRLWAKRELRERDRTEVLSALERWVGELSEEDPRYRHHQLEAVWTYRWLDAVNADLLRELLDCEEPHARAASTQQLRYWHEEIPDAISLLKASAIDSDAIVRMEAAIAASWIGTEEAFVVLLSIFELPHGGHLEYAMKSALGSRTLRQHWNEVSRPDIARMLADSKRDAALREPSPNASQAQFDSQPNLKRVSISCQPERMLFTVEQFVVRPGQPIKIVFSNPDATDHNLVFVQPGAMAEVGMAANEMAKDPRHANSNFIPSKKRNLILEATPMIGPTRRSRVHVLRFKAPSKPGVYPFLCTFPGHWVVMNGIMVVANDKAEADALVTANQPKIVREWKLSEFESIETAVDNASLMRGMQAFVKASCHQCHVVAGHGVNLGPNLTKSIKKYQGKALLRQIIEPSSEIHEEYRNYQFLMDNGKVISGVISEDKGPTLGVVENLLVPNKITTVHKREIDQQIASRISPMPLGLINVLTRQEIMDLLSFVQASDKLPEHLQHHGEESQRDGQQHR